MKNASSKFYKTAAALFCSTLIAPAAVADIPDIDSSGWSTDPNDYGMSAAEYINADSRAFFANFMGRSGVNQFFHFTNLSTADDRWVVSPNNDTIYSIAIVNARQGFTLDVPDVGDRFLSIQIITEDHMTPFYLYGDGQYTFTSEDFETDFVAVGIRTGTDATANDVRVVTEELQPQYAISGAAPEDDLPSFDAEVLERVRAALLAEYSKLPSSFGAMQKRVADVEDWEYFTYVTAGAWGLSADENAMYAIGGPENAVGGSCYTATFPEVPVDEFFSITVYGPQKYLMSDTDNIVSSNQGVVSNDDGSFDVAFGGEDCRGLAPNFAFTPEDGWNLLLRAYRPDVEEFRAYRVPDIVPAE